MHTDAATKMKFRCNYCEREFSKQGQLQSHEMKKHGVTIAKPSKNRGSGTSIHTEQDHYHPQKKLTSSP